MKPSNRPVSEKRGRPRKALRPPTKPAQSLSGGVRISADDLIRLMNAARLPMKATPEALPMIATKIGDAFDRCILIGRGHGSTALRGAATDWAESLQQWIDDGATMLGGDERPGASPSMASKAGAAAGAAALLTSGWPTISADAEQMDEKAQNLFALLRHELIRARVLELDGSMIPPDEDAGAIWDHCSIGDRAEIEAADLHGDDDNAPSLSAYDTTRSLVFNTLAGLAALRILADGLREDHDALHVRRRRDEGRWHLMRALSGHYEALFERPYATSRSLSDEGEIEVDGPAVRWTKALFALCQERVREEVEAANAARRDANTVAIEAGAQTEAAKRMSDDAARAARAAAYINRGLPELDALVRWSKQKHWGPAQILSVAKWAKKDASSMGNAP